jgi:uncharacterized protein YqgC (DUF456 family)
MLPDIFHAIQEFFRSISWSGIGSWSLDATGHLVAWLLIITGFLGTFLPVLPGPVLIVAGALVHRLWLGADQSVGWVTIGALVVLLALSILADSVASAMGAKWFGATKWGMWGAIAGGLCGLFFGIPGWLVGPLVGAFAGELLLARKQVGGSLKSTWGTFVGIAVGLLVRGGLAVVMIVWFIVDLAVK